MKDQVKAFKAPSPIIILVCVIVFCAIASYIIPAGVYDRVKDVQTGKMVVDPSTFHYVAQKPTGFLDFFTSINKGFKGGISIIAFLFMVGGSLNILAKTGAIVAGLSALVEKLKNRSVLLIPVLMTTLATFSTLAGCNEEYLAFTPLVVSVALALGFDSLTALGMLFCSVAAGYGAGCTQPFSVGVAQGIAGVPIFSGLPYRMGIFVLLLVLNISYVMYHARKVKKDPKSSPVYEIDLLKRDKIDLSTAEKLSTRQAICLGLLGLNFVCIIVGVLKFDFYMNEISAIFLIMGILSGIICRLHPNDICDAFLEGCKGMMLPCLAVAMCKAATILLDNAKVMDTIIYYLAGLLEFVGAKLTKVMRPLFKVPGRAAVDCITSWIGDGTLGVMLTCNQYEGGYYTAKEASIIATLFSAVSITFTLVVLDTVGMLDKFGIYYLIVCFVGIVCAIVCPYLYPLRKKPNTYLVEGKAAPDTLPEGYKSNVEYGMDLAMKRVAEHKGIGEFFKSGAKNACSMWFGVLPSVMAIGTVALILANYTPIFEWLGIPFRPLLQLLQVPEANAVASTMIVGFTDMLTPAVLIAECTSEMAKFIVAVVSVTQVLYLSEVGGLILGSKLPLNIWELFVIFLERTIISLLIVCPIAHLLF